MGAYAVKANEEETAAIREFARLLGLCFQIKDDIFDYYDDETIGKPTGNDLREGKITLPLLHVLADVTAPAHEEMLKLSQKEVLTTEEIHILTDYAKENGGIEYAYETMSRLRNEAMAVLDTLPEKYDTEAFRSLIDFVISRKE